MVAGCARIALMTKAVWSGYAEQSTDTYIYIYNLIELN